MKAVVLHGRCLCADQCGGGSRGEHMHNLNEFMRKLSRMLTAPDLYGAQYSPGEWNKVWLEPNGFVVLGKFWDDFYVTEEVVFCIYGFLSHDPVPSDVCYDQGVDASSLLRWYQQELCTQRVVLSAQS